MTEMVDTREKVTTATEEVKEFPFNSSIILALSTAVHFERLNFAPKCVPKLLKVCTIVIGVQGCAAYHITM